MTTSKTTPLNVRDTHQLQMFVLDVLRHDDAEQLSSIMKLLNDESCIGWRSFWPVDFTMAEVEPALSQAMSEGFVLPLMENVATSSLEPVAVESADVISQKDKLWFRLTPQGRQAWDRWEAPTE